MRIVKIILAGFLVFSGVTHADTPVTTEDKPAITVSEAMPEFVVKLKSNPTTGYSWFLRDYNSNLLTPVKHVYEAATDKKLVGAAGYELWTFRVRAAATVVPQQTMIRFVYTRPWQTEDTGTQKVFKVTTVVTRT